MPWVVLILRVMGVVILNAPVVDLGTYYNCVLHVWFGSSG